MMNDISIRAIPVANDVIILGEPVIGGTLKGSYIYKNEIENPEGTSKYQWLVNDVLVSKEQELRIISDYVGKKIVFVVTPVAVSGETGVAVYSDAEIVIAAFQNITQEESDNSFMKQTGDFSFYEPEPADRILISNAGAFSLIDSTTQNVYVRGQKEYGAVVPDNIQRYLINNPATVMFATETDFAALVPLGRTNQLLFWGKNMPQNPDLTKLRNIKSVYSNGFAFVYIYNKLSADNKWLGAVGKNSHGAEIPESIHLKLVNDPPLAVYSTYSAFAVRTTAGKVYAWGFVNTGGVIDKSTQALLSKMKITRIISTIGAFCAIDSTGYFVCWGHAFFGGQVPASVMETILDQNGVKSVIASQAAFCAITKGRAKAVCWGASDRGGQMNNNATQLAVRGNIVMVKAAAWAFCMVNAFGQSESWGAANSGGSTPNQRQSGDQIADFGQLMDESGVKSKIEHYFQKQLASRAGTNNPKELEKAAESLSDNLRYVSSRIMVDDGEVSIYSNESSFFLLAQDEEGFANQVLVWGQANGGGHMSADTYQSLMSSVITSVYCTNGAYGVICDQGRTKGVVVVWGATLAQLDAGEIPTSPPEIKRYLSSGVTELYSIKRRPPDSPTTNRVDPSFAARHESGAYVLWGGNVTNQVFIPSDHIS
ncbi:hypothetical protein ACGVWS_04315 [Enterobacteriaceae bacterium LUAb1]